MGSSESVPPPLAARFDGGGFRMTRLVPKESSLVFSEIPFARSAYFRGSLLAIHEDALALFATKMSARFVPNSLTATSFEVRLSWA